MKVPEWHYPLWRKWNKDFYMLIKNLANKSYPKIVGNKNEINQFIRLLISSQKMKDYRGFLTILSKEIQKKEINVPKILERSEDLEIPRGIDKSWAVWDTDKKICLYVDELRDNNKIDFVGSQKEIFEFILRFCLSQLLVGWQSPILYVLIATKDAKKVRLSELNNELRLWDYTKVIMVSE